MGDYHINSYIEEYGLYFAIGGLALLTVGLGTYFGVKQCNKKNNTV